MERRLKVLVLIKPFWVYPTHKPKGDMIRALETYADVYYWDKNGHIKDILKKLNFKPDFIFHYDIAWNYGLAPKIEGLDQVDILTGCYVIDLHWNPKRRIHYFDHNKIDLIFSATKHPFLQVFPEYKKKLRWLPWSINPRVMTDWGLKKSINSLLMGLTHVAKESRGRFSLPRKIPPKGRYAFRDAVFEEMKSDPGFVFHPHPGHYVSKSKQLIANEDYAKVLNQAKIFFTCGGRGRTGGVAVLKFFEAPACKTLLIAEPNMDIEDLGFVDGQSYVACNPNNIKEKVDYYLNNHKEREKITQNGFNLVHKFHTNDYRAKQLIMEIKSSLV